MSDKTIHLVVPDSDIDPGDEEVTPLLISPEGADPNREVPGFFIIQIDKEPIWSNKTNEDPLPMQFLSLDLVHAYLKAEYGWKAPLRVTSYVQLKKGSPRDFPAIWGADRKIGRKRVQIRVRYLGSFRYWDGRLVDPTKVGTIREFN